MGQWWAFVAHFGKKKKELQPKEETHWSCWWSLYRHRFSLLHCHYLTLASLYYSSLLLLLKRNGRAILYNTSMRWRSHRTTEKKYNTNKKLYILNSCCKKYPHWTKTFNSSRRLCRPKSRVYCHRTPLLKWFHAKVRGHFHEHWNTWRMFGRAVHINAATTLYCHTHQLSPH